MENINTYYKKYSKGDVHIRILFLSDLHSVKMEQWLSFIDKYSNPTEYDMIITLGDIDNMLLKHIEYNFKTGFKYGILGNHDYIDKLEYYSIKDLHLRILEAGGFYISGFRGSHRYKTGSAYMFTQKESIYLLKKFEKTDMIVCHSPPKGIHDRKDLAHQGLKGILKYIKKNKPKYCVHGHVHYNKVSKYKKTTVISVYGGIILDTDTGKVRNILELPE